MSYLLVQKAKRLYRQGDAWSAWPARLTIHCRQSPSVTAPQSAPRKVVRRDGMTSITLAEQCSEEIGGSPWRADSRATAIFAFRRNACVKRCGAIRDVERRMVTRVSCCVPDEEVCG